MQLADMTRVTANVFLAVPCQQAGEDAIDVEHPQQYSTAQALLQVSAS